jgi:hypothetical protein
VYPGYSGGTNGYGEEREAPIRRRRSRSGGGDVDRAEVATSSAAAEVQSIVRGGTCGRLSAAAEVQSIVRGSFDPPRSPRSAAAAHSIVRGRLNPPRRRTRSSAVASIRRLVIAGLLIAE